MSADRAPLSPSQRAALVQKQLSGSFSIEALLSDLRALASFDLNTEAERRAALRWMILSIVACVVSFIVQQAAELGELLPLTCGFVVSAIYFGVRRRRLGQLDVSDNVREVALPFLVILKQDVARDTLVKLELDLAPPTDARKQVSQSPTYSRGRYNKIVDTHYRDAWFAGSAQLADGATVRWSVLDELCVSKRRRTNTRKGKTKLRHWKRCQISISVALPNKLYRVDARQVPPRPGLKLALVAGEKRTTLKLSMKLKDKFSYDPIGPRALIDAVSMAYRCALPAQGSAA